MRVCVCTIVHHPEDARILHRQIRALLDAGHAVTYIAPFRARNVAPWPELEPVDVPRAAGRHRLRAIRAARHALAVHAPKADIVLLHDPELLFAVPRGGLGTVTVWDVHEDTVAALPAKGWLPSPLRVPARPMVRRLEARAERRMKLMLAEEGYRDRFSRDHPVVPNTTYVPETPPALPGGDRVIYIGSLSQARGTADLVTLAELLRPDGITVELTGQADEEVRPLLRDAQREGVLRWYGFVPNDRALRIAEGALAGISLLRDVPNYRHSLPTKIVEYMSRGIPVVTTPNPLASEIVDSAGCGIVVPYEDPHAAAEAIRRLRDDEELRNGMGKRGHEAALARFSWPGHAREFVAKLETWANAG